MNKIEKALERQIQLLSRRSAKTTDAAELCTLSETMIELVKIKNQAVKDASEPREVETQI